MSSQPQMSTMETPPQGVDPHDAADAQEARAMLRGVSPSRGWLVILLLLLGGASLGGLFYMGWIPWKQRHEAVANEVQEIVQARPVVTVAAPRRPEAQIKVVLPAETRPMKEAAIYARTNGYLDEWKVDTDARVKENDLLAVIKTPEIDAELDQARAASDQAGANADKAKADLEQANKTFDRFKGLVASNGITPQELDEKHTAVVLAGATHKAAQANAAAAAALVQKLTRLQEFEQVKAPFAGTITARNFDKGALITAGAGPADKEMFHLAQVDELRVFVKVPQVYATLIKPEQDAFFTVRNYAGRKFPGKVSRTSGMLDPQTRTLRVQIDIPNKDFTLMANMYGEVTIVVDQKDPPLLIPTASLIFNGAGTQVACVRDGIVHMATVAVGRDTGTEVEINNGLTAEDQVITNPGENLADGVAVEAIKQSDQSPHNAQASPATQPRAGM